MKSSSGVSVVGAGVVVVEVGAGVVVVVVVVVVSFFFFFNNLIQNYINEFVRVIIYSEYMNNMN